MSSQSRVCRQCVAWLLVALCVDGARAVELDYEVTAGVGHSDNIARTSTNEIEEDIVSGGLTFSLSQMSSRVEADLVGNFAYYDYLDDTYDSEVLGNFVGSGLFHFVPERFTWMIADNFGQVLTDPFEPATPENREYINYLTTGPDFMLGFGSLTRLRLGGRYTLSSYEESPFDSDASSGELELSRLLSSSSSIAFNVRAQQIEYDDITNANYDQNDAFLRYSARGARTVLAVDAGYSELERESSGTQNGVLFRFEATRRVSESSTVNLALGHEFSGAGAAFATAQSGGSIGLDTALSRQVPDPFTHEYATLGWAFSRNRTGLRLSGMRSEQSYEGASELDQTLTSVTGAIDRALSTTTNLVLESTYVEAEFEEPGRSYDEITAGLTFTWRLSRVLSLHLTYDYFDRSSDSGVDDYTENRFWLSIGFGRGVPRRMTMRPTFAVDAVQPGI